MNRFMCYRVSGARIDYAGRSVERRGKMERGKANVPRQNVGAVKGVLLIGRGEIGCTLEVDAGNFVLFFKR